MDGRVEQHFSSIGFKRLVAVECIGMGVSNQNEIGSSARMRRFLGTKRQRFDCTYFHFTDALAEDGEFIEDESWITYYDCRKDDPDRSAEYRLTYPAGNPVMQAARAGDYCWLAQVAEVPNRLMVVVAHQGTAIARQLDRLLGTAMRHDTSIPTSKVLVPADLSKAGDNDLSADDTALLGLLGVPVVPEFGNELDRVIERFGGAGVMPKVKPFCAFVRDLCPTTDVHTDIDTRLHQWHVFTTEMFYGLEKHVVGPVLDQHFANQPSIDLKLFFKVAMQFQQSRYSRAGSSWEYNLAAAFERESVRFIHNHSKLADGTKPDFLFPSRDAFVDPATPRDLLTFVGAKTTTKERWMQLVAEGHTVQERYLATMDRDLNHEVLATMANQQVIPVIPSTFVAEHYPSQPPGVISFAALMDIVRDREGQLVAQGITASLH